ncbi:DUF3054 domain-containing protein [Corynebacterium lactis]|uniref:Membrane protein n=1 Tax=Corynebacterium lactis RW2-5 TaxID=1408189 RepID=A0A0K2H2J0_9CORY|nr:DUF3054 domain-containing protein [Corynebacterium lactis]ALA68244.1 membrane protein [Corynebacterium lactis RW2-5]
MNSRVSTFVIDTVAIIIFAVLARLAHNKPDDPFTFLNIVDTFWPFFIGVILGTLLIAKQVNPRSMKSGSIVWIATVVVGLGIWGIRHAAFPHWSFILVASITSALLLFGWRGAAGAATRKSAE